MQIIALTAYSSDMMKKHCMDIGMDSLITKPIDTQSLTNIISDYIDFISLIKFILYST